MDARDVLLRMPADYAACDYVPIDGPHPPSHNNACASIFQWLAILSSSFPCSNDFQKCRKQQQAFEEVAFAARKASK